MDLHHNECIVAVDEAAQRPSFSSALPCWDAVDSAASGMSCILCGGPAEIGKGVWLLETAICGPVTVWPRWLTQTIIASLIGGSIAFWAVLRCFKAKDPNSSPIT